MTALQPYLISEFKSGINNYVQPWMRPQDAFDPLVNAYMYRGTINKRAGIAPFANRLADHNPVMGIMQRIDESTGQTNLVVCSTQNLYLYDTGGATFNAITSVSNSNFWIGTATGTKTLPTFFPNLAPSSVSITNGITTITDDGAGNLSSGGIFAAGSTINYATGVATLNFTGSTANTSLKLTATSTNYFTGNNTNFFNHINWQPTSQTTGVESISYLYLTNNVDPVTLFDGTSLSRPILYIDSAHTNYIKTASDVNVYKNSLLLFKPTLFSEINPENQAIYWSAVSNPTNFIIDVPGNGGVKVAPTGDVFIAEDILRDQVICFFSNSTWIFRFTGINSDPFRIDRISVNKRNAVPYGTVSYDERCTSLGSTGFIACDGVNVQRYDIPIIDYFETQMSEQYYAQCYSQRYDNLNQTWMNYVSNGTNNPVIGLGAPGADSCLIYNHLENTWATFTWPVPATCLGLFFLQAGTRWEDLTQSWESTQVAWRSFVMQKASPILLMGDVNGFVYQVDNELNLDDDGTAISVDLLSTRWNPFAQAGQKVQVEYIDVYYSISSTDPTNPVQLGLYFYADNSELQALQKVLTLDGPAQSEFAWKRVYCNLIGEFIQMEIIGSENGNFQILGLNLWMRPAGRFTP